LKRLDSGPLQSLPRKERNWLLGALIIFSLGIHAFLIIRIAEVYHQKAVTRIELTLQDVSRPVGRSIPRPPRRIKRPPLVKEVKRPKVIERPVPSLRPMRVAPVAPVSPAGPVEEIDAPQVPDVSAPLIAAWRPEPMAAPIAGPPAPVITKASYFELVKLSIERNKKYPEAARAGRIEGRVNVGFMITPDGNIKDVGIVKKSRSTYLDEAAVSAVKRAAPFPKPPKSLFKGSVRVVVTIVFELT
jgi:periplasmic protein TonB